MFKDRKSAGILLCKKLQESLAGKAEIPNIVVALPRGGVPVAVEIAEALKAPLTVLVSKKIGAPFQAEFAIGAVSSSGVFVLNENSGFDLDHLQKYIDKERQRLSSITKEAELECLQSAGLKAQIDFSGKRAIVVDDGIATGMTVMAAAKSLRQLGAAEVIVAAPVVALESVETLLSYSDQVLAVETPRDLGAIGLFYEDFHQVPDEELKEALSHCAGHWTP